jgi:hypothetical protein
MAWYNRLLLRPEPKRQSEHERLIQLSCIRLRLPLTPAEVQVLKCTASSQDLPSPDDGASRPEDPYANNTPRPEVRADFVSWLATDVEARPYIHPKGIRVYSSTILGELDLGAQSHLPRLDFRRCTVTGGITLEFSETKGIHITDCCIAGGIKADGVCVHGPVILYRTVFDTEISFINATIESNLECQGAKLGAKLKAEADALTLDGATVKGDVFFSQDFECCGEIRMLGTTVAGSIHCTGAKLLGNANALALDKANVSGNVYLNSNLHCTGTIRLHNCTIKGNLIFVAATVDEVLCKSMKLTGDLVWCGVRKTPKTLLNLNGACVRAFHDDEASWPAKGQLELVNFVYTDLIYHELLTQDKGGLAPECLLRIESDRIPWLKLQSDPNQLHPQPWLQMGKYLESVNNKSGSRHVHYKYRCLAAHKGPWYYRRLKIAFACLEESPVRVLVPIAVTLALGTLIFAGAHCSDAMISTARDKDGQPLTGPALGRYPPFQPFVYTLDNALPLVKLGVDDKWTPDPNHKGRASFPRYSWLNWLGWFNSYWYLAICRWVIILLGWFQAAVLGAALTNRFKS